MFLAFSDSSMSIMKLSVVKRTAIDAVRLQVLYTPLRKKKMSYTVLFKMRLKQVFCLKPFHLKRSRHEIFSVTEMSPLLPSLPFQGSHGAKLHQNKSHFSESVPLSFQNMASSRASEAGVQRLVIAEFWKLSSTTQDFYFACCAETSNLTVRSKEFVRHYQACEKCGFLGHMRAQCPLWDQQSQQACSSYKIGFVFERVVHTSNYGKIDCVFRHCFYLCF